jgi:hypothetical protein
VQVADDREHPARERVQVSILEAGEHRAAFELDHALRGDALELGGRAHCRDATAADSDGLGVSARDRVDAPSS